MKVLLFLIVFVFLSNAKPLFEMNQTDIDTLLSGQKKLSVQDRIEINSRLGLNTPYRIFLLGEGPCGKYDQDPLYNLKEVDCLTFCEQVLALSIAEDFESFFWILQKIRYENGTINFLKRNHYFYLDWISANNWLLENNTENVGKKYLKEVTKKISKKQFFINANVEENEIEFSDSVQYTAWYIPKNHIMNIADNIQSTDMIAMVTSHPAVFVSHVGFAIRDQDNQLYFRNATSRKKYKKVIDISISDFIEYLNKMESNLGIILLKVKHRSNIYNNESETIKKLIKLNHKMMNCDD